MQTTPDETDERLHVHSKLNIGSGAVLTPGWVHADREPIEGAVHADLTDKLPFSDGEFDVVYAAHVMQMIEYPSLDHAFSELHRVTAPGGVLRVLVPDIMSAIEAYMSGDAEWFPQIVGHETSLDGRFSTYLTWYGTARTVFTIPWLVELMKRAGFEYTNDAGDIGWSALGGPAAAELDSRQNESIAVEAQKA